MDFKKIIKNLQTDKNINTVKICIKFNNSQNKIFRDFLNFLNYKKKEIYFIKFKKFNYYYKFICKDYNYLQKIQFYYSRNEKTENKICFIFKYHQSKKFNEEFEKSYNFLQNIKNSYNISNNIYFVKYKVKDLYQLYNEFKNKKIDNLIYTLNFVLDKSNYINEKISNIYFALLHKSWNIKKITSYHIMTLIENENIHNYKFTVKLFLKKEICNKIIISITIIYNKNNKKIDVDSINYINRIIKLVGFQKTLTHKILSI